VLGGIALGTFAAGTLGAGGLFLAGAAGMLWGVKVGSLIGVMTRVQRRPNVDRWCELELDDQSALVVVRVRDWAREPEIAEVLTHAGSVSVQDHTHLDHPWQELEDRHSALF
jgi:outer membrane lipoprotein SlyB